MKNIQSSIRVEADKYLKGLAEIYKKHGIKEVKSNIPIEGGAHTYYVLTPVILPSDVQDEIAEYILTKSNSFSLYFSALKYMKPTEYLYYKEGEFYEERIGERTDSVSAGVKEVI